MHQNRLGSHIHKFSTHAHDIKKVRVKCKAIRDETIKMIPFVIVARTIKGHALQVTLAMREALQRYSYGGFWKRRAKPYLKTRVDYNNKSAWRYKKTMNFLEKRKVQSATKSRSSTEIATEEFRREM